ncbi:MAG: hypothetical protein Q9168_005777, partial [Polycauliona sp. 1 TL-2023]
MSQSRLQLISTIGMGVLVGTSLIVIIPEGVDTLYGASEVSHTHTHTRRYADVRWPHTHLARRDEIDPLLMPGPVLPDSSTLDHDSFHPNDPPRTPTDPGEIGILEAHPSSPSSLSSTTTPLPPPENHQSRTPHAWVGISLILGFILMYLLDTLPLLTATSQSRSSTQNNIYSLSDLSSSSLPPHSQNPQQQRSFSTTLGLVIHAAADGIAL